MPDRDPIVDAVLADGVVKAVLENPATQTAVAAAQGISPATGGDRRAPGPAPDPAPVAPVLSGQLGVQTPPKPDVMLLPSGKAVAVPTTTEEENRATVGQRRINLIWETTQSIVATAVTAATLYVSGRLALKDQPDTAAFLLLSNVFFLVLGTYFNRTNHVKTGGVGKNEVGR